MKKVESSKKSKVLPEDTTDDELYEAEVDIEDKFTKITKKPFFQDRTLIIKQFVEDTNEWIVDNKPHRFGKSMNVYAQVLYLSKFIPLKNPALLNKLKIDDERNFEEKFFKKCSVLYLDFSIDERHVFDVVLDAFKKCL